MRVFHLVKGLGRGGAETLLVRTAAADTGSGRRNGYGYFLPWKDALVPELQEQGCLVRCFPAKSPVQMLARVPELLLFLKSWRPDLLHCHLPLAGVIGRLVGRILGVPVVYTEHNLQERYHRLTSLANRLTWTLQDRVIAVSAEVSDSILRSMPEEPPVQIVLNGVDCDIFRPQPDLRSLVRAELGLSDSDYLIGTVAVFRKQKRLDLWLDVARRMASDHDNVHFLLVGDGPEMPLVQQLVDEFGLASRLHLPGLKAQVLPYFCAMDTFFMSSDFEGLPVALLEAMACQTPVVATTAGGIGEVITCRSQGLLAGKGQAQQLHEHLCTLYQDPVLRAEVAQKSRERVVQAFSQTKMSRELELLYLAVLGKDEASAEAPGGLSGYCTERNTSAQESLDLITASLGSGSERSPRTLEFFNWKHRQTTFGSSYSLALRTESGGQLVGLRLFQRWDLIRDSDLLSAVRAVDTSTHPDHQRKGIFSFLTRSALSELRAEGVDLVFNTPNSNSLPGYLKMGWELVELIPVRAKILSPGRNQAKATSQSFDEVASLCPGGELDSLIASARVPGRIHIAKSLGYLRWRYAEHPTISYRFTVLMGKGKIDGLAVWCETKRRGLKELVICELFARTAQQYMQLLDKAVQSCSSQYAVVVFTNNDSINEATDRLGFRRVPLKTIALVVNTLKKSQFPALLGENWAFSTGDLQVF